MEGRRLEMDPWLLGKVEEGGYWMYGSQVRLIKQQEGYKLKKGMDIKREQEDDPMAA